MTRTPALSLGMSRADNAIAAAPVTASESRAGAPRAAGASPGPRPSDVPRTGAPRADAAPAGARRRSRIAALPPGLLLGSLGIVGFSFSLPATRLAVADLDPWLVAFGRATVAAGLAAIYLLATRAPRPTRDHARSLAIVAAGVVVGFPLLTSLALEVQTAAHGAVVIAILPAATAVAAVKRAHEHPSRAFWLAASAGLVAVLAFVLTQGVSGLQAGDVFLLAAVVLCAIGYAEGGALSRTLGGPTTICWALVLSAPLTVAVTGAAIGLTGLHAGATAWLGFAYVAVVSMFLGFFAWYAGLARGGVARIGQVQLAQPVLTLGWSAALLGEDVGVATLLTALAVLACVAATQRAR
jgi:drug/metabolite transporter (DMT)-like permease